jgi:hypothetical protein
MLGGDCSPCCTSCPDYWVLMQADGLVVSFSWVKNSTTTPRFDPSVLWSAQWSCSENEVLLQGGQVYGNPQGSVGRLFTATVPMAFTLGEGTPSFNVGGPFSPRFGNRVIVVTLESYLVPISGEYGAKRATKGGMLNFNMVDTVSLIDYIGVSQRPCHNSSQFDPCRMSIEYYSGSSSDGTSGSAGVVATAQNNGEITLASSWVPQSGTHVIKRLDYRVANQAAPQSLECSGNNGIIPVAMSGGMFFYTQFDSGGGVTDETLAVDSIEAVFGDQRYNILAAADEASWQIEAASYINGISTYQIPQ